MFMKTLYTARDAVVRHRFTLMLVLVIATIGFANLRMQAMQIAHNHDIAMMRQEQAKQSLQFMLEIARYQQKMAEAQYTVLQREHDVNVKELEMLKASYSAQQDVLKQTQQQLHRKTAHANASSIGRVHTAVRSIKSKRVDVSTVSAVQTHPSSKEWKELSDHALSGWSNYQHPKPCGGVGIGCADTAGAVRLKSQPVSYNAVRLILDRKSITDQKAPSEYSFYPTGSGYDAERNIRQALISTS